MIQLAKFDGLKVIASAGSEDKVAFMKECGADVAFNYKITSTKEVLKEHGPINLYVRLCRISVCLNLIWLLSYWDNVGGETLDNALEASAPFAHFVVSPFITMICLTAH